MSQGAERSCNANLINLIALMENGVFLPLPSVQVIQSVPTTATRLAAQALPSLATAQLNLTALEMARCVCHSGKFATGRTIAGAGKTNPSRAVESMSALQIMEAATSFA
jgi:hypothetical protein